MFIENLTPDVIPSTFGKIALGRITKSYINKKKGTIEITAEDCPPYGETITFVFSDHGLVNMSALSEYVSNTNDDFQMFLGHSQASLITKVFMHEMQELFSDYYYHEASFRRNKLDGLYEIREQNIMLKNALKRRRDMHEEYMETLIGAQYEKALDKHISYTKMIETLSAITDSQFEEMHYNHDLLEFCYHQSGHAIDPLEELYPDMTFPSANANSDYDISAARDAAENARKYGEIAKHLADVYNDDEYEDDDEADNSEDYTRAQEFTNRFIDELDKVLGEDENSPKTPLDLMKGLGRMFENLTGISPSALGLPEMDDTDEDAGEDSI